MRSGALTANELLALLGRAGAVPVLQAKAPA
jgi:hypothetical protein